MSRAFADVLAGSDCLFDGVAVAQAVDQIATQINADLSGERPLFLTVMQGGMFFASMLAVRLDVDPEFDYLHASRYRGATRGGTELVWLHRPETSLRDRQVLLVDDILDEGHTLKAVRAWCEEQGPAAIRIAVLADKPNPRRTDGIQADYVGLNVPDRYVFGVGMDWHGHGRGLPSLHAVVDG